MSKELTYFIGGIFTLYGLSCAIMCYRAIRHVTGRYREEKRMQNAYDAKQMESLLAQAYRILNDSVSRGTE